MAQIPQIGSSRFIWAHLGDLWPLRFRAVPYAVRIAEDLAISSQRLVTDRGIHPGTVTIRAGRIASITDLAPPPNTRHLDAGDLVLMPGLVDTHVHVNEPGRTDWEGFTTAGRAAAAGGITTIVVMPLNCTPAATSPDALHAEADAARAKCLVDYGLWGGIVPGNTHHLEPMWRLGALGFKCFLVDSGVDDFQRVSPRDLEPAMHQAARLGAPVLAHAEDPQIIEASLIPSGLASAPRDYRAYLASRPPESEDIAIRTMIDLCRRTGARTHIVHVSAASALPILDAARREKLPLTTETCPHYLAFAAEDIPPGATLFKCAPPIRQRANQAPLWEALRTGVLDMIVSDHSPCPPALKELETGSLAAAWGGISSLQLGLPIIWSKARQRAHTPADLARWMCTAPAHLAGLAGRKGRLAPGHDADLALWDPDEIWTVKAAALQHRHPLTPYDGAVLQGAVKATFVRGRQVFAAPGFEHLAPLGADGFASEATGQWLTRTPTRPASQA